MPAIAPIGRSNASIVGAPLEARLDRAHRALQQGTPTHAPHCDLKPPQGCRFVAPFTNEQRKPQIVDC